MLEGTESFFPTERRKTWFKNFPMSTPDQNVSSDNLLAAQTAAPARASRGVVLLAEDDRSIRRYLEVILQRAGYTVIAAADGLEAMKAVLAFAVDAVVTDAIMPHLNGYELCRFLRRQPNLSHLPVILLSGIERPDAAHEEQARADVYLAKPVRPEELTGSLARLLKK